MMNGNKHSLDVYLGKSVIAQLRLVNDALHWHYTQSWLESGYPVSPHLPLNGEIPVLNVQRFLRNLLPEGAGFEEVLHTFHLSKYNTFGLVSALGLDIPGSLIVLAPEQSLPDKAAFRIITDAELEQRLDNRDAFSLIIWDAKPRLSVAGVQDKINIMLDPDGQPGFGEGRLCSTYLLKFEKQKLSHLVLNEYTTMKLAEQCGLKVANISLKRYGNHPALLIERFDRHFVSMNEVKRRHIIDGCQALNLAPEYKYERNFGSGRDVAHIRDGVSFIKLFDFANRCINPAVAKQQILDWALFNLLVFNFDAHGKNISFFIGQRGIELTPFYDLVNIKMYPEFDHQMAMALGDEFDADTIHAYQLADFADSCSLNRGLVAQRLHVLIKKMRIALKKDVLFLAVNEAENQYVITYKAMIQQRCEDLMNEIEDIVRIDL
ncbi:MAG: HipA domain-containing protein [Legionellales bacterium]